MMSDLIFIKKASIAKEGESEAKKARQQEVDEVFATRESIR